MRLLRPKYLAIVFAAFFGVVGYYALQYARRTNSAWFPPDISQIVYQTTMVGGVLVLLGLFVTAALSPRILRASPPSGLVSGGQSAREARSARRGATRMLEDRAASGRTGSDWEGVDEFVREPSSVEPSPYDDIDRAQDAAAVSAALSRM